MEAHERVVHVHRDNVGGRSAIHGESKGPAFDVDATILHVDGEVAEGRGGVRDYEVLEALLVGLSHVGPHHAGHGERDVGGHHRGVVVRIHRAEHNDRGLASRGKGDAVATGGGLCGVGVRRHNLGLPRRDLLVITAHCHRILAGDHHVHQSAGVHRGGRRLHSGPAHNSHRCGAPGGGAVEKRGLDKVGHAALDIRVPEPILGHDAEGVRSTSSAGGRLVLHSGYLEVARSNSHLDRAPLGGVDLRAAQGDADGVRAGNGGLEGHVEHRLGLRLVGHQGHRDRHRRIVGESCSALIGIRALYAVVNLGVVLRIVRGDGDVASGASLDAEALGGDDVNTAAHEHPGGGGRRGAGAHMEEEVAIRDNFTSELNAYIVEAGVLGLQHNGIRAILVVSHGDGTFRESRGHIDLEVGVLV
mmetsp:Transcript_25363/g.80256  ORF Transcript_25363/g.80256 Transcript_25363/m.80256 type:complete len:416 (+) Transcript_25363:3455-4702(+)